MSTFQPLLINSVWVLGLAGVLATLSYMDWYRAVRQWTFRQTFQRPVALVPLYLSLTCFCAGLLLNEVLFSRLNFAMFSTLWRPLVWVGFTLFFAYQSFQTIMYGRRYRKDAWIKDLAS